MVMKDGERRTEDAGSRTQDAAKEQGAGDDGVDDDSMRKEVQAQKVHSQSFALLLIAVFASTTSGASVSDLLCRNKANGIRALVPGSCSRFYECQNGVAQEYSCANFYDFKIRSCAVAATQSKQNPVRRNPVHRLLWEAAEWAGLSSPSSEAQIKVSCLGKPDGFLMASPERCNDYYICRHQRALKVSCGDRYFNGLKGICDLPENTSCVQS
uniref:GG12246 n=1 Tax=Drosophila erecta TaxID=7220 RepID=B3P6J5_DROER